MNTKQFNNSLVGKAKAEIVDFETFKAINRTKKYNTVDGIVARIESVSAITDGYEIKFSDCKINVFFYGAYERITSSGSLYSGSIYDNELDNGHLRINIQNVSFYIERLIAIVESIYEDCVPDSFKGWSANVIDCSGNPETAKKFGLIPDYSPSNLEWCLYTDQLNHYGVVKRLFVKTGKVYKISALDREIFEVSKTKTISELIELVDSKY